MSLNSEITRVKNAKAAIKAAIEEKGISVGAGTIDTYASKIDQLLSASEYRYLFTGNLTTTAIIIPEGVDTLKYYMFMNSDLESVTIPDSLSDFQGGCFYQCSKLTSVTFGENAQLTRIGYSCFEGCTALTSVTLPKSLTEINSKALKIGSATNKATIVMKATWPPELYNVDGIGENVEKIIVPASAYDYYIDATNWSAYADIIEAEKPVETWFFRSLDLPEHGIEFEYDFFSNGTNYSKIKILGGVDGGMWYDEDLVYDDNPNLGEETDRWMGDGYKTIALYKSPEEGSEFADFLQACAVKWAETWVLNYQPPLPVEGDGLYQTFNIPFVSNGMVFTSLSGFTNELRYGDASGDLLVVYTVDPPAWVSEDYRTLHFGEVPSGELLTWLQSAGTKQE